MPFANKRIILTGGSGGIGGLTAAALIREGADVAVMSRSGAPRHARHIPADLATLVVYLKRPTPSLAASRPPPPASPQPPSDPS